MMRTLTLMIFLIYLYSGCKPENEDNKVRVKSIDQSESENYKWKYSLNKNPDNIKLLYTPDAIKIDELGRVLNGSKDIFSALKTQMNTWKTIDSVYTIYRTSADKNGRYEYEIGGFQTNTGSMYNHLLIWSIQDSLKQREMEIIVQSVPTITTSNDDLSVYREKWIDLCNLHNASNLVHQMYTSHAVYYNHKPLIIGVDAIASEYSYMNNTNYSLTLVPLIVKPVNENIVFEIGQCSGSYNGKYIIVWSRSDDGSWKVLIDSNI